MGEIVSLGEDECWDLMSARAVGRIGFDMGRGPRIHPVNYAVHQRSVVLRTAEDTELARFVELFSAGALVAFEVDDIDFGWEEGWSVLVGGRIERVDSQDERRELRAAWPRPWAEGERNVLARVTPLEVTGRRIIAR